LLINYMDFNQNGFVKNSQKFCHTDTLSD